jgi:hypothetical protein
MHFDGGAIERNMIDLDVNDVVFLRCREDMTHDALLDPAIGTCINRMPVAEFLWQPSPFAAVFRNIQNGIEYL